MPGLLATLLNWLLKLCGVGKVDPVQEARKETAARVNAQTRVQALERALKTAEEIRKAQEEVTKREKKPAHIHPGDDLF